MTDQSPAATVEQPTKVPILAHFLCGWPLCLLFVGGAVGGACGGAAYAINMAIYKSNISAAIKVVLNILVGIAAIGLWFAIAMVIQYAWR